jgi:bacterioferritin
MQGSERSSGNRDRVCVALQASLLHGKGHPCRPGQSEFLEHAAEEQAHADRIAERIVQLGGSPNFSPEGLLSRSHSEYVEGTTLIGMITEDLVAERIAIDSYREIATYFAGFDTTTRKMIEEIQASEEEHADDLAELLERLPKGEGS